MDIRVVFEAAKLWLEQVAVEFLSENKAVIATAVTGAIVVLLVNVHPAFAGMEPFIEQIVLGIIAAIVSVAWRKEHGRLNKAQAEISELNRSLRKSSPNEVGN